MRLATILGLALCVAVAAPIAAVASEGVTGMHKHRVHMHQAVYGSFNPAATALAPPFAIVPTAPAARSDDDTAAPRATRRSQLESERLHAQRD